LTRVLRYLDVVAGAQKFPQLLDQLVRGQSITDCCIDWEKTARIILAAAPQI